MSEAAQNLAHGNNASVVQQAVVGTACKKVGDSHRACQALAPHSSHISELMFASREEKQNMFSSRRDFRSVVKRRLSMVLSLRSLSHPPLLAHGISKSCFVVLFVRCDATLGVFISGLLALSIFLMFTLIAVQVCDKDGENVS